MKTTRKEERVVKIEIPVLKCDFCGNTVDNQKSSCGMQPLWAKVRPVTKCGCMNEYHICPKCIEKKLTMIHNFHHDIKGV